MIKIELTQEYINELIGASKRVTKPPKKDYTLERGSYRKDFELYSNEYDECFKAFIRNNHELPDHFSIGLVWITEKAKLNNAPPILFRCNGPHGGNQNIPEHFIHHIHSAQLNKYDEQNGFYICFEIIADPTVVAKLERTYKLDENIVRYLSVIMDKKTLKEKDDYLKKKSIMAAEAAEKEAKRIESEGVTEEAKEVKAESKV